MFFDCAAFLYKVAGGGWPLGNIMPASSFSFDGSHVFLTYPQCGSLSKERVRDFLLVDLGVRRFLVASELHSDGQPHIHAYASWEARRRFVGAGCFDVDGHHPNIQKPRSAKAVAEYCGKYDTEALRNFENAELESSSRDSGWRSLLRDCPDAKTFLARVEEHYPRDLCLSLERLLQFCEWRWGSDRIGYSGRTRDEFLEPDELREWVRLSLEVLLYPLMPIAPVLSGGGPSPLPSRCERKANC